MATITVPSDPTLPVAGAEIKAPPLKDWITNIRTFLESTSIDEGNVDTSGTDGIVGKSIAQTITGLKTFSSTAVAAGGLREVAKFEINPVSGTPAANDGLRMTFTADDAGGAATAIGYLDLKMTDASASSEDSEWRVSTIANAASVTPLVVNSTAITMTTGTVAVGTNATVGGTLVVTGDGAFGSLTVGTAAISEGELEMLDGITPGTIVADKAVVVNSNKDASDFRDVGARNIVLTGELDAVSLDISTDADIDGTLEADAITLNGTALGALYSPIAGGSGIVTTGALNSGSITSGFGTIDTGSSTITTTGVVTAGGLTIGSAVIVAAELEMIDGITAGTAAASKAVVLDGSKNIATIGTIGSGAITSSGVVTATGFTIGSAVVDEDELEILDGATVTTAELNLLDALDRGSIIYGNASGVTAVLGQGGGGTVLTSDGTDISWAASTTGDITSVVAGTGMTGGATSGAATLNVIGGNGITANTGDVAITAAQTTVTSVLNAALALGRDADNQIKFGTDDQIIFEVAGGDGVTFKASGEIEATSLDISGSADIDGTLEADAITLNGTALGSLYSPIAGSSSIATVGTVTAGAWESSTVVASAYLDAQTAHLNVTQSFTGAKTFGAATQFNSSVTVGVDDAGYDVIFYGNAASANATWDASADDLIFSGAAGLIVPDGQLTLGATAVTSTAAELNILDGVTSTAAEINLLDALDRGSIIYGNASSVTTVLGQGGAGTVLTSDGDDISWAAATGGHTIQEEGSGLTQRTKLNFVGAGVTATDGGGVADSTIVTVSATGASMPLVREADGSSDPIALASAAVGDSLVSDTSPQLGGNLDVLARSITTTTTNGDIAITPHGTGKVVLDTNLTFDGTTMNVVGNAGVGIARTDGTLHVHTATAGTVAPNANQDDLVVENSTHGGISILVPDASDGTLAFGSPSDAVGAILRWNHDADLFRLGTANAAADMTFEVGASAEIMRLDSGTNIYMYETSNAFSTSGLTINQGAFDTEILALKSSDVAHGVTDVAETDTYAAFSKQSGTAGAFQLAGFGEGNQAAVIHGTGGSTNTTKTTSAAAVVELQGAIRSGTARGALGADGNLVVFNSHGAGARFIFDTEGTGHADVAWTTYDTYDDLTLISDMEDTLLAMETPDQTPRRHAMEATGIIGKGSWHMEDGKPRAMVNFTKLAMLHHGALIQTGDRFKTLEDRLLATEDKLALAEYKLQLLEN